MDLTTYDKNTMFSMDMYGDSLSELDNKEAVNNRFTLVLIRSGSGIITIDNKKYSFIAPVIMCLNEKEHIVIDKSLKCQFDVVYFHPNIIDNQLTFENVRNIPDDCALSFRQNAYMCKYFIKRDEHYHGIISMGPLTCNKFKQMFITFKKLIDLQSDEFWPCRSRSNILQILFGVDNIYYQQQSDIGGEIVKEVDKDIYPIISYLYNNYNKKITIKLLTSEFNMNRTTLSEKFSKSTGDSIINYLNKLRIKMAAILLRDTRIPIYEVMEKCGFNDSAHFLRTFKKYSSQSPKEYREKYCWVDKA